eukprot:1267305-Pyramimonas_sp.AAC.1
MPGGDPERENVERQVARLEMLSTKEKPLETETAAMEGEWELVYASRGTASDPPLPSHNVHRRIVRDLD